AAKDKREREQVYEISGLVNCLETSWNTDGRIEIISNELRQDWSQAGFAMAPVLERLINSTHLPAREEGT
ncbi:hypothetical protein, partial [Endozoicomonas sp. ONNA2]|uniref:hypothetical protein n=1 Tax=Endozoicomonas sp. ONNA2 TaxID=2828741 RepID=UPI00214959BB